MQGWPEQTALPNWFYFNDFWVSLYRPLVSWSSASRHLYFQGHWSQHLGNLPWVNLNRLGEVHRHQGLSREYRIIDRLFIFFILLAAVGKKHVGISNVAPNVALCSLWMRPARLMRASLNANQADLLNKFIFIFNSFSASCIFIIERVFCINQH